MKKRKEISVFAGWKDNKKIGTLFQDIANGKEIISFEYDRQWLASERILLDPAIPFAAYRIYPNDRMLFGAFEDSCPDRWGRKLIDRRESVRAAAESRRPVKFLESDYMLGVQDECRSGGFRFRVEDSGYLADDKDMQVPPMTAIRELEQISLGYERGTDNRWITRLVDPGSSLGGARPKANVSDQNGELWIAKFPSKNDSFDVGAWEKAAHDLAKACGLSVPESKLYRHSENGSTFLVKRFDRFLREGHTGRIHFASAMTMLGLRDGKTDGFGFLDLAEKIIEITGDAEKNLEELFRRMIFDIAISNQDDHLRNHGFLLLNEKWQLSPAYDMNPVPNADFLSMNIDMDNGYRSFEKAMKTCGFYHLSQQQAEHIIHETATIISDLWRSLAKKYHISENEQKIMAPAFELAQQEAMKHSG